MRTNLARDIIAGAAAGAVGTVAMDAVWYLRHRRSGGEGSFTEWQFSTGEDDFDDVGAPATVAQRVTGVLGIDIPDRRAGLANDVVHWLTGTGWGVVAGALARRMPATAAGAAVGTGAIATAYTALVAAGIYQPVWEYDAETVWKDVSAHAVFGAATGVALAALRRTG